MKRLPCVPPASSLTVEEALREAVGHHREGRFEEAERMYRAILEVAPEQGDANHNLGVMAQQQGRPKAGLGYLKKALEGNPGNGQYWLSYIEGLLQSGEAEAAKWMLEEGRRKGLQGVEVEALAARLAVLERTADPEETAQLLETFKQGRYAEAAALAQAITQRYPERGIVWKVWGAALKQLGRNEEALAAMRRAAMLMPADAQAHNNLGGALKETGRLEEAEASCRRAMELKPDFAEAHYNLGVILQEQGRLEEGEASFREAIRIRPEYAEAHNNLGIVLQHLGRTEGAETSFREAIRIKPDFIEAYNNRGNALKDLGRLNEASASYDQAIRLNPDYAEAYNNRGNILGELGRSAEALENFERAIVLRQNYADAYLNKAFAKLLAGEYEEGWKLYEKRWQRSSIKSAMTFPVSLWLGESSLQGKTILLHAEQGLGDTLQFCRYVKLVAARGAKVILRVQSPLVRLLSHLEGASQVIADGDGIPESDVHCPLMSLPLAFKTTLDTIPADIPYLMCEAGKSAYWKSKLGERTRLRVGLVWSGGFRQDQPELWSVNARRNIPLAKLEALNIPDVEFYSLQKGEEGEAQLRELIASSWRGPKIIDFTQELPDFSDTAALIDNLDLVISVDTSVAHLAGALGKPVWILNRFDTCWRWLQERKDSPWYPTVTLFRQASFNDWSNVVAEVSENLDKLASDFESRTNGRDQRNETSDGI